MTDTPPPPPDPPAGRRGRPGRWTGPLGWALVCAGVVAFAALLVLPGAALAWRWREPGFLPVSGLLLGWALLSGAALLGGAWLIVRARRAKPGPPGDPPGAPVALLVLGLMLGASGLGALASRAGYVLREALRDHAGPEETTYRRAYAVRDPSLLYHAPVEFEVSPGNAAVVEGGDVLVTVRLSRSASEQPLLWFRAVRHGDWKSFPMERAEGLNSFAAALTDVHEDLEYFVYCRRNRSERYRVRAHKPAAIREWRITYRFPRGLGRPPVTKTASGGDIAAPAGTRIRLTVVAEARIVRGRITFDGRGWLPLKPGETAAEGASVVFDVDGRAGEYTVLIEDEFGQTLTESATLRIAPAPER